MTPLPADGAIGPMIRLPRMSWPVLALVAACGSPRPPPTPRAADKASLFGDPTLVPTRDGEAARRELAMAGEVAAALRATGWLDHVHVDVELADDRTRVLVAGRRTATAPSDLEQRLHAAVTTVCSERAELTTTIGDGPPPSPARALDLPLGLALLGLGGSVALSLDRLWRRWRRRQRVLRPRDGSRAPR